jgi:hypothetical protein
MKLKNNYFFIIILSIITLNSCKKDDSSEDVSEPTADFTYSGANTYAPANVSFSNNSTNANSYHWDFGDNNTSNEKNPSHIYLNGGTYTVTLKVTGDGGTKSVTKTVNISNKPTKCKIKRLYVNSMPFIDPSTGSGWDSNDGPDVFFRFLDTNANNNTVLYGNESVRIQNVTPSMLPIYWYWNSGSYWQVPSLNDYYFIDLIDYDPYSNNDYIGYVSYNMENYMTIQNHYPTEITLNQNNITIKLEVEWSN